MSESERAIVRDLIQSATHDPLGEVLTRLQYIPHPLAVWGVHMVLDRREVPPCLRWPEADGTPQHEFVTFCADLLWFTRRHPQHVPGHRGWRGLFINPPGSAGWHATALRQYLYLSARGTLSHGGARGLALADSDRADLMTMPTTKMAADRRSLRGNAFEELREALLADAREHPDRSGVTKPTAVADRRAHLWRLFVLSQRNTTETARRLALVSGAPITRQVVSRQIAAIERALRR